MFPLLRAWSDLYNGEHGRAAALMRAFAVRDIAGRHDWSCWPPSPPYAPRSVPQRSRNG
jgi:hypothetical protein